MARKTKEEKALEARIDAAFKRHGSGHQFDIFDLGKVMDDAKAAVKAGKDLDAAMVDAIAKYEKVEK